MNAQHSFESILFAENSLNDKKERSNIILTIKCAKCRAKIFKYLKIGKGRVLRCYKARIKKDYSIHNEDNILCVCGNTIGTDNGRYIKMKQDSFIYSGTKE